MRAVSMTGWAAVVGMGVALAACGGAPDLGAGSQRAPSTIGAVENGQPGAVHFQLIDFGSSPTARPQEVIGDEHAKLVLDGAG